MSRFPFRHRFWVVLLAALLSASLTAALGVWQMRRAALKEALQADMLAQQMAEPLANADFASAGEWTDRMHRRARVSGTWQHQATVFLDNRQMGGRQGFYVITPLKLTGDGRWLLVQRGWAPRDFQDRTRLPEVPTPGGLVVVTGRIARAPAKVYELGAEGAGPLRQNLDVSALAQAHSATVFDGSLVQLDDVERAPSDGLLRNWPQVASDVHKHHGYAFQWFGLCALIVMLYVWFQVLSPMLKSRDASQAQR